jgi:hypothetical protein
MWTRRSKQPAKRKMTGAARKGSSSLKLRIGDRVRIIDIPSGFKDPNCDLKDPLFREMRTAELFRFCLGREFVIQDFNQYGYADLSVHEDRAVRKKFGLNTIWIEPKFLECIKETRGKASRKRKAN